MASLNKYPCFCNSAGLERFESKTGRGFLKCKAGSCPLLIPEEKYPQLMDAFEMRVHECYKPNNFPLCHCDQISSLWVSQSKANPGRPYFPCRDNEENDKCDFFKWADVKKKTKSHARMQKRATRLKPLESSDEEQK